MAGVWGVPLDDDDDDAPPPGFGPNRFEQMMNYCPGRMQPTADAYNGHNAAALQPLHQTGSNWQAPTPSAHCSSKHSQFSQTQAASSSSYSRSYSPSPTGPRPGAAVGAVRQFQRALSSSLGERQEPPTPAVSSGRSRTAVQPSPSPTPDYGDFNDDDEEYGASSRKQRSSRQNSSRNPSSRASSYNNLNSARTNSCGNLSISSSHSHQPQHSQSSPALSRQATPPKLKPAEVTPTAIVPASTPPVQQQPQQLQQQAAQKNPSRAPTPDYGEYEDADDYGNAGSKAKSSSGRRRVAGNTGGNSSNGNSAAEAAVAANQALAGIAPPLLPSVTRKGRAGRGAVKSREGAGPGAAGHKLSAERTAQLEAELGALRAALAEAEAREMEAQMAVVSLATDNSTLQSQLQGMRTQKQQLETMLLFGGGVSDSSGGGAEQYDPCAYDDADGAYSEDGDGGDGEGAADPEEDLEAHLAQRSQGPRMSWADEMDNSEGLSVSKQQPSWTAVGSDLAPGAADVLEAEAELRRLGLLPDTPAETLPVPPELAGLTGVIAEVDSGVVEAGGL